MASLEVFIVGALNYDRYVNVPALNGAVEATTPLHDLDSRLLSGDEGNGLKVGGGAAITAIALATLGVSSAVAGAVGNDAKQLVDSLQKAGVRTLLKTFQDISTAVTMAYHADGQKKYVADTLSNGRFTPTDLHDVFGDVALSRLLMRTGYPWMPQVAGTPTAKLFNYAKRNRVVTALDMSNPERWPDGMLEGLISKIIPQVDVLCANERELYALAWREGDPQPSSIAGIESLMTLDRVKEYGSRLLERGVSIVNVHYGERGTVLVTPYAFVHEPSQKPASHENPTGCGNLQNAGIIYHLLRSASLNHFARTESSLSAAARFANALAVLRLGGTEFPSREAAQKIAHPAFV